MTENTTLSEDGTISRAPEPEGILGTRQPLHIQAAGGAAPTLCAWSGLGRSVGLERGTSALCVAG